MAKLKAAKKKKRGKNTLMKKFWARVPAAPPSR
jgi:hypothetical protein